MDTQQPLLLLDCCAGQGQKYQDQGWQEGARGGWQVVVQEHPACCTSASAHHTAEAGWSACITSSCTLSVECYSGVA